MAVTSYSSTATGSNRLYRTWMAECTSTASTAYTGSAYTSYATTARSSTGFYYAPRQTVEPQPSPTNQPEPLLGAPWGDLFDKRFAEKKAFELLREALEPEQQVELENRKGFIVKGNKTGTKYLIFKGRAGNIHVLDDNGKTKHRLCFHPEISCPDFDTMLAQKLVLENNEDYALQIANRHAA